MNCVRSIFIILGLLYSVSVFSVTIRGVDDSLYSPSKRGLVDLSFRVKIEGLEKELSKITTLTNLKNIYFNVIWRKDRNFLIEIEGLPSGFIEKRNQLKLLILSQLEYVVPKLLAGQFKGYREKIKRDKRGNTSLEMYDPSSKKTINRIVFSFDKKVLSGIKLFGPGGVVDTLFGMTKKSWTGGQYIVESSETTRVVGVIKQVVRTKVDYEKVEKWGFPSSVVVETTYESLTKNDPRKKKFSRMVYKFSLYSPNNNVAALRFAKLKKMQKKYLKEMEKRNERNPRKN